MGNFVSKSLGPQSLRWFQRAPSICPVFPLPALPRPHHILGFSSRKQGKDVPVLSTYWTHSSLGFPWCVVSHQMQVLKGWTCYRHIHVPSVLWAEIYVSMTTDMLELELQRDVITKEGLCGKLLHSSHLGKWLILSPKMGPMSLGKRLQAAAWLLPGGPWVILLCSPILSTVRGHSVSPLQGAVMTSPGKDKEAITRHWICKNLRIGLPIQSREQSIPAICKLPNLR